MTSQTIWSRTSGDAPPIAAELGSNSANPGIALPQSLLQEEAVTASDFEQRLLASTETAQLGEVTPVRCLEVVGLRLIVESALGVQVPERRLVQHGI